MSAPKRRLRVLGPSMWWHMLRVATAIETNKNLFMVALAAGLLAYIRSTRGVARYREPSSRAGSLIPEM